jgi:hypothetical protein
MEVLRQKLSDFIYLLLYFSAFALLSFCLCEKYLIIFNCFDIAYVYFG